MDAHVAQHLAGRFLVGEQQRASRRAAQAASTKLAPTLLLPVPGAPDTSVLLARIEADLPPSMSSRPAMPEDTRSVDRLVLEPHRRDGQHRDAGLAGDQERVFVGAVLGAAVLDDTQPARGHLVDDAVIEQDHAGRRRIPRGRSASARGLAALAG